MRAAPDWESGHSRLDPNAYLRAVHVADQRTAGGADEMWHTLQLAFAAAGYRMYFGVLRNPMILHPAAGSLGTTAEQISKIADKRIVLRCAPADPASTRNDADIRAPISERSADSGI